VKVTTTDGDSWWAFCMTSCTSTTLGSTCEALFQPRREGLSPLHIAVERDDHTIVKMLLASGCDKEAKVTKSRHKGSTALLLAATHQSGATTVAHLLNAGCDKEATNSRLETVLYSATSLAMFFVFAVVHSSSWLRAATPMRSAECA
jgi:hypothetical protein